MITTQYINLNMVPSGVLPILYMSQYDVGRPLGMVVYNGGEAVDLDTYTCTIEATRTDGTPITAAVTTDDNIGAFVTTATMTNKKDKYLAKLVLFDSNSRRVASLAFVMCVTPATMDENAESIEEDVSLYQQYTGTVQSLIADIREDIAELNDQLSGDPYQMPYIKGDSSGVAWQDAFVTPEMFGAVGDGVTDDSAALQAAIDSGRSVFLPDGTYLIGSTVTISSNVTIFGSRDKSVLKFTGDGVLTTNGNLCNVRLNSFAVYVSKASGNAIEIIRENTVVAESALRITCVDFIFDNSLTGSTANMLYLYGVREGIISNCFFCGDTATAVSGISAIYAVGDSTHLTMNISISECVFTYVGYAINAVAEEGNARYLAGFRIANNTMIGCGYGVRCIFFDTPTIIYNTIDYCGVPIYCGASSNATITGNYLQTKEEGACLVVENLSSTGAQNIINISDNIIHSSNADTGSASTITDGIQLIGYDSPLIIRYVTIRGNAIYRVRYAVVLTNVKYANIADNHVFYATRLVANSNAESIRIHDNYVQSDVTSFATSIGTMWDVAQNQWGGRYTGGVASGTQEYTVAAGSSESYDITFSGSGHVYYSVPAVSVAFKDVGTTWEGMYLAITSVSMTGFTVKVINSGSASHTNVIRWTAIG